MEMTGADGVTTRLVVFWAEPSVTRIHAAAMTASPSRQDRRVHL